MKSQIQTTVINNQATIGESFSWISFANKETGETEVREVTGVDERGTMIISGPLNEEQKARWKRVCNG